LGRRVGNVLGEIRRDINVRSWGFSGWVDIIRPELYVSNWVYGK
jgi:hypothetical protein